MKKPALLPKLNLDHAVPLFELKIDVESEKAKRLGQLIKNYYFGYSELKPETVLVYLMVWILLLDPNNPIMLIIHPHLSPQVLSDKNFNHAVHRTVKARVGVEDAGPTYVYRFALESPTYGFVKGMFAEKNVPGTCHGDDLPFLFKPAFLGKYPNKNSVEWKTIERVCDTWVAFATTGNPNNETLADLKWEPISQPVVDAKTGVPTYKCLNIANEVELIDLPEADRMRFWDSLYTEAETSSWNCYSNF